MYKTRRLLVLTLFLCSVPYIGLFAYLALGLHGGAQAIAIPSVPVLFALGVIGGVIPLVGLWIILRRLLRDRRHFRLNVLLEAYASLILIFAIWYTLLQISSFDPSFLGVSVMWQGGTLSLSQHVAQMHRIFFDFLYLSVMTVTTVGYGDMVPLSPMAKLLTALEGLIGIGFVGVVLGNYFSVCVHKREKK